MRKTEIDAIANKVYRNLHKEVEKRREVLEAAYENSNLKKRVDAIIEQEETLYKEKEALGYNESKYYFDNSIEHLKSVALNTFIGDKLPSMPCLDTIKDDIILSAMTETDVQNIMNVILKKYL